MSNDESTGTNGSGELLYNIGLSLVELNLILTLIDDEPTSDEEEVQIRGMRRKIVQKRNKLRRRVNGTE